MNTVTGPSSKTLSFALLAGAILIISAAVKEGVPDIPFLDQSVSPIGSALADACPVSEPAWVKPPDDSAVQNEPEFGYYFLNEDRSIWASAWWVEQEENLLLAGAKAIKMGWFRPEGAPLSITGQRMDALAPPLEAHVPCCYPTRFQAAGLIFPEGGCWEVTGAAADNELSFVLWVEP